MLDDDEELKDSGNDDYLTEEQKKQKYK